MQNQNLTILLVDDDFNERGGLRFLIEREKLPLNILEAPNGKRALDMIRKEKVDILFADIRMPYMDGLELSAIVHEEFPEIKIIIFSAYGEFEYAKKAMEAKAVNYLLKPIDVLEFYKVLNIAINRCREDRILAEQKKQRIQADKTLRWINLLTGKQGVTPDTRDMLKIQGYPVEERIILVHMETQADFFSVSEPEVTDCLTESVRGRYVYPSTFFEPFNGMQYLGNGILVLDESGNPVYSRKSSGGLIDNAVYAAIAAGSLEDTAQYVLRGGSVPTTGWRIYYYVDSQMITGQLHSILLRTLQVVGAVTAIAFVVITLFSRSLSKRILLLKDSAERVASGDLDTVIETEDTDEIGVVINSFGSMTKRLNHLINEIYKMQLEKKAVELKALQAQINPHFLYNALSSINWKAIRQGNEDISQLASTIATFYRTSLNNGESITSVENELANIKAYIEIQRHMHDFPFTVDYEIEDGVQQLSMLNFLLQPIVENAFKHGIDYTDETWDGRILITCATKEEYLIFTIRNNGPRIPEHKARESLMQPGKGYGLFNIQERIALYYGEDCGLTAGLDENGYTCFTVKIRKSCTIIG